MKTQKTQTNDIKKLNISIELEDGTVIEWSAEGQISLTLNLTKFLTPIYGMGFDYPVDFVRSQLDNGHFHIEVTKGVIKQEFTRLLPPRWKHGHDNWIYEDYLEVYIKQTSGVGLSAICLGDRMAYVDGDIAWCGQASGSSQLNHLISFGEALDWVSDADHVELGCYLWSQELDTDKAKEYVTSTT